MTLTILNLENAQMGVYRRIGLECSIIAQGSSLNVLANGKRPLFYDTVRLFLSLNIYKIEQNTKKKIQIYKI